MTEPFDRRRILTVSVAAGAGALVPVIDLLAESDPSSGVATPVGIEETPSGVLIRKGCESVRMTICAPDVGHVVAGPAGATGASPQTPWLMAEQAEERLRIDRTTTTVAVRTSSMSVEVDVAAGLLRFL